MKTQSRWTKWLCMWQSFNHKYWTPRFSSWSFLNDYPPQLTTALALWPQSSEHLSCSSSPKRVVIDWFLIAICRVHRKWNDNLNGAFCSLNVSNYLEHICNHFSGSEHGWCSQTHQIILGSQKQTIVKWEFISNEKPLCTQS